MSVERVKDRPAGGYRVNSGNPPSTPVGPDQELIILKGLMDGDAINDIAEAAGVSSRTVGRRKAALVASAEEGWHTDV